MRPQALEDIADALGLVESALQGIIALTADLEPIRPESPACQFASLLRPFAGMVGKAYAALLEHVHEAREQARKDA